MLEMFLVTFTVMLLVITGMALGAMAGRKPLTGSCGGVGKLMGEDCEFCEKADQCTEEEKSHCDGSGKIVLSVQAGCPVELKVD
jgi:uncharacterized protein